MEPKIEGDLIDNCLVMEAKTKNMIKAIVRSYTIKKEGTQSWSADFVQNKGEGQIFLLHGRPGVGKTCTAGTYSHEHNVGAQAILIETECVAEYTHRPLLSLTCGDIGTKVEVVERKLTYYFKLAELWGAILLLDEADIYLEERQTHDLDRNSLVSVFLRVMEYYQGVLFLTTNRVGHFDDAFISRIHVVLHFTDFTPESRAQVWSIFFKKLERDRPDIKVHWDVKEYVDQTFQTAVALAEYEANGKDIIFKVDHLRQVVHMSRNFKTYLETLHKADEQKRAWKKNNWLEGGSKQN
ncbi:MAG: hypothetical protein M1839_001921 [Geoglossum umbratile]|nr:MAG: hypothetical protein M1839_001921 [Geoglossum umbratile]